MELDDSRQGPGHGGGPKLASVVASKIESDIIDRGWPTGAVLGSEASLIEKYDVSRAVLREAVRLLEHRQVARMRRGPNGGLVVTAPASSAVAESVAVFLEFADVSLRELDEARHALELLSVRLAAENITEEGIERLRANLEHEMADEGRSRRLDLLDVHREIAEVTGNPALEVFVNALLRGTQQMVLPGDPGEDAERANHEAHRAVLEAIVGRNPGLAEQRMDQHLNAVSTWLVSELDERSLREAARRRARADGEGGPRLKLPERIARRIKDRILDEGHEPGDVLGSESDFLQEYGVSRAVFREAVRILEYYGIAGTRRGPGGGLVVREPDASHVASAVITYLEFMAIDPAHLSEARIAVELSAVELAVDRVTPEAEKRLYEVLERDRGLKGETLGEPVFDLHLLLPQIAGNRPLEFFTGVLTRLQAGRVQDHEERSEEERQEIARSVAHAHERIIEAVLEGDRGLARHRLARHLEVTTPYVAPRRVRR